MTATVLDKIYFMNVLFVMKEPLCGLEVCLSVQVEKYFYATYNLEIILLLDSVIVAMEQ